MECLTPLTGGPEQPSVPANRSPKTPEELQARKSMWQQVFDKMSSDRIFNVPL